MSLTKQFNTRPLYQQVADEFISRIVSQQWAPGQAIENETEIARSLGISLGTVRKAFDVLAEYKVLERHQGRGTVVNDLQSGASRSRFSNIFDRDGRRISGDTSVHAVSLELPDVAVAEAMGTNQRTPLIRFERRRMHLGRCFMVEDVFLRAGASAQSMSQDELDETAASRWFGQDLAIRKVEEIGTAAASESDRDIFRESRLASVVTLRRVILSYQNRPLELRHARCHLGEDLVYSAR